MQRKCAEWRELFPVAGCIVAIMAVAMTSTERPSSRHRLRQSGGLVAVAVVFGQFISPPPSLGSLETLAGNRCAD